MWKNNFIFRPLPWANSKKTSRYGFWKDSGKLYIRGPLIVLKNGSIFLAKPYYENTNKIAVLWEELENLLNKQKPYYREIRTMRGLTVLHAYCYYLMRYQSQSQFCTLKMSHANVHLKTITKQLKGKICLALHRTMIVVPNLLHVF